MSDKASAYIIWNVALMERLLIAIITIGAHLYAKKWREAASNFNACSQMFIDIFQANEENAIRRLKEKFTDEQSNDGQAGLQSR